MVLLNEDGEPHTLYEASASQTMIRDSWGFNKDGRTPMLSVSERALTLRLVRMDQVLLEVPVFLQPGEPTELSLTLP